jgi:hypothetical protein
VARHYGAAVCERGHVISARTRVPGPGPSVTIVDAHAEPEIPAFCTRCGARVLMSCPSCGFRIRGHPEHVSGPLKPPDFCDTCSNAYPWLDRQGQIWLLENRLKAAADIEPADRLRLEEALEALRAPDLDEKGELELWKRVQRLAGEGWNNPGVQNVATTLLTAWMRDKLG